MHTDPKPETALVWDLPLRLFHWTLAGAFTGAYLTAESERWRDVHAMLGYTALAMIGFRLVWGIVGTRYARFGALPFSPTRAAAYLRSLVALRPDHHVGHNPAGSLAIYVLLALAAGTAATGLATFADLGGEWLSELHEGLANAMLVAVVVHVAAVVASSLLHRENLALAMLTGRKRGPRKAGIAGPRPVAAAVLVAVVLGLWTGVVPTPGLELQRTLTGVTTAAHAGRHAGRHDD